MPSQKGVEALLQLSQLLHILLGLIEADLLAWAPPPVLLPPAPHRLLLRGKGTQGSLRVRNPPVTSSSQLMSSC